MTDKPSPKTPEELAQAIFRNANRKLQDKLTDTKATK